MSTGSEYRSEVSGGVGSMGYGGSGVLGPGV